MNSTPLRRVRRKIPRLLCFALLMNLLPAAVSAHGGVVEEDDLCVINIGYLRAHFKIYLPQQSGHEEYCEDVPARGESVFVMEYQHDGLAEAEIDFRIIENTTGKGEFARIEDVERIDDIDAITIRYEPPAVVPDVFTLLQSFESDGEFIGIVSASYADTGKVYTAVFPFEVGYTGIGMWPWFVAAVLFLQLNYWFMSRRRRDTEPTATTTGMLAVIACASFAPWSDSVAADNETWVSKNGHFVVSYVAELQPLTINRIHRWTLHVETAGGEPLAAAAISISGGMPEHNHGLPTEPRVVESLGNGNFRVDGMRFHMRGFWELRVSIDDGRHSDVVTIPLQLK